MQHKVNMFEYNVKLFNICGIIPSDNINSSLWKTVLFRMFLAFSFLLSTVMMTLQIFAVYYYWGNVGLLTDCLGLLAGFAATYISTPYFIYYWEDVSKLIETLETKSICSMELVRRNARHTQIFNDNRNMAILLSKATSFLIVLSGVMYILPTFVRHLSTSDEEILQEAETEEGFTKHFVFVMWLPPVVKQPFAIRLVYVLQCICTFRGFTYSAAFVPIEVVLLVHTGTQFKLMSSILNEMDDSIYRLENSNQIVDKVLQQENDADGEILSKTAHTGMSSEVPKYEMEDKSTSIEGKLSNELRPEMLQYLLQIYNANQKPKRFFDLSSEDLTSIEEEDTASSYFLECIKLHQLCIRISAEINTFLSPCIFLGAMCVTAIVITNVFQLSLAINTKYIIFTLTFLIQLFVYSWCGEAVTSESRAVGDIAYGCLWYERSTRFKQLLLMFLLRSQTPIRMSCGPIWKCSYAFVTQLLRTMYTFFTVLRQVHEA